MPETFRLIMCHNDRVHARNARRGGGPTGRRAYPVYPLNNAAVTAGIAASAVGKRLLRVAKGDVDPDDRRGRLGHVTHLDYVVAAAQGAGGYAVGVRRPGVLLACDFARVRACNTVQADD